MLRWVLALLGAVSGVGCRREQGPAPEPTQYAFDIPLTDQVLSDLIPGRDPMTIAHAYTFAPPLPQLRADKPVAATAYIAFTMPDGYAVTGKYAFQAILRSGDTGGPAGFATERFVEVADVRLVEKLRPPRAPPGVKALLPGQGIVRTIPMNGIDTLDDRYVIELPADMPAEVWLLPRRHDYDLDVTVTRSSVALATARQPEGRLYLWNSYTFRTTDAGVYEVRVRKDPSSDREPDSYMICVGFGRSLGFGSKEAIGRHKVVIRERLPEPEDEKE